MLFIDFFVDFDHLSGFSDTLTPSKKAYLDGSLSLEDNGEKRDMVLTYQSESGMFKGLIEAADIKIQIGAGAVLEKQEMQVEMRDFSDVP